MKTLLQFATAFVVLLSNVNGSGDYYWVGGAGDWNDPTCWAKISGGSIYHATPPSALSDVYFDQNSFSEANQVVSMNDASLSCRDFNVANGLNAIFQQSFSSVLNVYGDFVVDYSATYNLNELRMLSNGEAEINTAGVNLGNNSKITLAGGGNYSLGSDLVCRAILIETGNDFDSNGHDILTDYSFMVAFPYRGVVDLSNSNVQTRIFQQLVKQGQLVVTNTVFSIGSLFSVTGIGAEHDLTSASVGSVAGETRILDATGSVLLGDKITSDSEELGLSSSPEKVNFYRYTSWGAKGYMRRITVLK